MESYLVAGAFFLMVFTPAIVGARNSARDSRLAAGEEPRKRFRIPSLSASLSNMRSRRRAAAPVAMEDPLQALALETPLAEAAPLPVAHAAADTFAQPAVYVKNFTFDVSRFNQPERHHHDVPLQIAAVPYAPAEMALRAVAAEPAAELAAAPEASAGEAALSYGEPEPLYVRRAVYGQRLPHYAAQEQPREEMVPYPYAPPFAYPAQAGPYMPQYPQFPMAGQVMPPMPPGYPPMPQAGMGMPFPNPYLYPMAFMPIYPMGFYPMPMPGPGYGQQQQPMGPMGPQLVEPYQPQPGYGSQARWEHRSATPRRSLFRRA